MAVISFREFSLKVESQRLSFALNGAHLEGPPRMLSEISCWGSCYLTSVKNYLLRETEKRVPIR